MRSSISGARRCSVAELDEESVGILVCEVLLPRKWVKDQWVMQDGADDAFHHV